MVEGLFLTGPTPSSLVKSWILLTKCTTNQFLFDHCMKYKCTKQHTLQQLVKTIGICTKSTKKTKNVQNVENNDNINETKKDARTKDQDDTRNNKQRYI